MEEGPGQPLTGQVLGGEYEVGELIQSGGMGSVYEAIQKDLGRKVAIKVLHPHLANDAVLLERFRREAEAAAGLGHPHIVQVTDFKADPGELAFLVMEHIAGRGLDRVMREDGILPPDRVVHVAVQVLDALSAAHEAGIVHRDLKPGNILLTSLAGVKDVVKLVDFGIAKLAESKGRPKLTVQGSMVGTPAFMSPEQARGETVDGRADIYAVGVIMYSALAGRLPYPSAVPAEIIPAMLAGDVTPLGQVRPDIDDELVALVHRAMAVSADERFSSADDMRKALERWLRRAGVGARVDHGVEEAPPRTSAPAPGGSAPPVAERVTVPVAAREPRAQRGMLGLAIVAALLLALTSGLAVYFYFRAARLEEEGRISAAAAAPPPAALAPVADPPGQQPMLPSPTPATVVDPPEPQSPPEPGVAPQPGVAPADPNSVPGVRPPRIQLLGVTDASGLYPEGALRRRLSWATVDMERCLGESQLGESSAPPVWHVDVDPAGTVRTVQTSGVGWPAETTNCVTETLRAQRFGPAATGEGGMLVVVFGAR